MDQQHGDHHPPPPHAAVTPSWSSSDNFLPHLNGPPFHHRRHHHHHHHNFSTEQNDSPVSTTNLPFSGHKRQFPHASRDYNDGSCVKLYVRGVPRTVREPDIQSFFGQYGSIVEVVILKDKISGIQQECCFVKYATVMEAERAIGAIHNQQTFPGGTVPIEIKYAVGEQKRLAGAGGQESKLYVGGLNKLASDQEVAEIFSLYGCVLEVFHLRDELKQNRGLAFIQFTQREMALAAIDALNGKYVMRGCDLPLVVRFAEPKKPRIGESRPGPYSREMTGQPMFSNGSNMYSQSGGGTSTTSSNSPAVSSFSEMADLPDCDWSEHICPDGNEYYYNCVTCESRWKKPEEYRFYEQLIQNGPQLHLPSQNLQSRSDPPVFLLHHAPPIQQELDHAPTQSVTSHVAVVAPACGLQGAPGDLIYKEWSDNSRI